MRKLIIVCIILLTPFILQAQEYSGEYKVVCKRVSGCPVINGTCPTCIIVGGVPKMITDEEIAEWGKRMQERNKYVPLENDPQEGEPSGWEWKGPTWRGLRVLY
jgi:hypothetical protein